MIKGGIPIGTAFGIPLRLHYSWFIIFALVTFSLVYGYFPDTYPDWNSATAIIVGVATSLLFFGSLLAHELMHSITAQRSGIAIHSITLFVFGGVSQMAEEPKKPTDELRIALAGPLTSLLLGVIFGLVWIGLHNTSEIIESISFWLGWINISLAVFNLIPGFPLDGGRVLRSILWWRSGNIRSATKTASRIGRGVGYLFIFGGLWLTFGGDWFNGLWLAFIGWFLENAAAGSYRQMALQDILKGHTVGEIMTQDCTAVPPDLPIDRLAQEHILTSGRRCFPVVENGKLIGLVSIHNIKALPQNLWHARMVRDAMTPFEKMEFVHAGDDLSSVMRMLTEGDVNQLPVVDNDGNIIGMIARDRLLSYISARGELGM